MTQNVRPVGCHFLFFPVRSWSANELHGGCYVSFTVDDKRNVFLEAYEDDMMDRVSF